MLFESGNLDSLNANNPQRKNWVVGSFVSPGSLLYSRNCEVKWENCAKGTIRKSEMNVARGSRTLVILLEGSWKITDAATNVDYTISKPGDYLLFDQGMHVSEALADSRLVVIRWYQD